MSYADYDYYTSTYLGASLTAEAFPALAERASEYIDYITQGRATGEIEAVKRACCALAEDYSAILAARASAQSSGGEVQSERVGSYSVTFRSGAETSAGLETRLYNTVRLYLANTGLLYRGGCCRCTRHTL